jgi:branched-chain amino acid aminotransferase
VSDDHTTAWFDGELVAPDAVAVRLDDHGFTIGDGVFETLLVRAGHPTFWSRHAARLARSLAATGMAPVDEHLVAGAVRAVLDASGLTDARLRITVSSGPGPAGLRRGPRPSVLVTATPLATPGAGASGGAAPVHVVTFPWARNERSPLAGVKSTSYAEAAALQSRLDATGAGDALLGDTQGRLSEALTANVFVEIDGRRLTPGTDCGCLGGIVRELLLEAGLADEGHVPLDRLPEVGEAFLTSSVAGVRPIASIDGRPLAVVDGPMALDALTAFRAAEAAEIERGASGFAVEPG